MAETAGMKELAGMERFSSKSRIRREPTRAPYSPWLSLPGRVSPSRSGIVSWSQSKERATATRASLGQVAGASERPARTRWTWPRQVGSSHRHVSSDDSGVVTMHQVRRKRRQTHGEVIGAVGVRRAVLNPLAGGRQDRLAGAHVEDAAPIREADGAAQHQRVFVEFRRLAGFQPAAWALHLGDAERARGRIDAAHVLANDL